MLPNSAPGLAVADQVKHQKSENSRTLLVLKYTRDTLVMPNTLTHDTDHSMVVSDIRLLLLSSLLLVVIIN